MVCIMCVGCVSCVGALYNVWELAPTPALIVFESGCYRDSHSKDESSVMVCVDGEKSI